jgi:hypothetical protein
VSIFLDLPMEAARGGGNAGDGSETRRSKDSKSGSKSRQLPHEKLTVATTQFTHRNGSCQGRIMKGKELS